MAITKKTLTGHGENVETVSNYISQINIGGTLYDISTHHGITFVNGNTSETWNGLTELEVVIPTIDQLISSPIVFAGTVGSGGTISWAQGFDAPALKGYLLYISADCTFGGQVCEAGDMAVYDGGAWIIISGENQVTIKSGTTPAQGAEVVTITATAKTVLDVEGKELALKLPVDLVKSNLGVTKNASNTINLNQGAIASVDTKYVTLTYTNASEDTVLGSNKTIALPSALTDGTVTFSGDTALVKSGDIAAAWTAGSDGAHESAAVAVTISGDVDLSVDSSGNDFVTGWTPSTDIFVKAAIKSASLKVIPAASWSQEETIATQSFLVGNPTFTNDSTLFATGISEVSTGADFIIPGAVSVSAETSKADSNGVVTDVIFPTLGDASSSTDVTYAAADASTGVIATIADPTVTINGGSVIASVSVNESHVLVFTPGTVTASASQGAVTYKKAQYVKTVVSTAGSVNYGSIQTAAGQGYKLSTQAVNATLTAASLYYMGVQTSDADSTGSAYTGLTASKGAYTAALASTASGSISAGTVITSVTDAKVPVLASVSATGSITGTVSTALTTSNVTVAELSVSSINIGTYVLGVSDSSSEGAIAVGAGGSAQVTGAITIAADTYVTNVYADADLAGDPEIGALDLVSTLTQVSA